jgi:hypothetical protein
MPMNPPFDQLISEQEIQTLRALGSKTIHPLVAVALHPGSHASLNMMSINTCRALHYVLGSFGTWATNLRPRLLSQTELSSTESALAEIRACGALLEAGYPVVIGGKNADTGATPEFHVLLDGVETIVEVWNRNRPQNFVTAGGTLAPFGAPNPEKEGDSVLTNVIQRVAGIKDREHQAAANQPFVVWADLQSVETMRFDYSNHLAVIMNDNGRQLSGGYWHALYGRKGDPLFEGGYHKQEMSQMLHEGRYYATMKHGQLTRLSGILFASPASTAFMEHPSPVNPVPSAFRKRLINIPRFEIGASLVNWNEGLVAKNVDLQRQMIAGIVNALQ